MPDEGTGPHEVPSTGRAGGPIEHHEPDDPYALGDHPSTVTQVWIVTRIILVTLLILVGFALVVGIVFRLT